MIRVAREAMTPRMSVRAAAKLAGISPESWGHVERGYQPAGRGDYRPVTGTPATVAHMAFVVALTPERLRAAGNPMAAEILEEMQRREAADGGPDGGTSPGYSDPTLEYLSHTPGLPDDVVRGLIVLARNWREAEERG